MKEVYVITCKCKNIEDWTGVSISQECYTDKEKAVEFCEGRLNSEELEHNRKMQKRKLINWFEFIGKDHVYEIKVLSVK